jgi:hypothetical protein
MRAHYNFNPQELTMTRLLILLFCLAAMCPGLHAQESDLPSFGEGNAVSLQQEYYP